MCQTVLISPIYKLLKKKKKKIDTFSSGDITSVRGIRASCAKQIRQNSERL